MQTEKVTGIWSLVSGNWLLVPGVWLQIAGSISGCALRVTGYGLRILQLRPVTSSPRRARGLSLSKAAESISD